MAAGLFRRLAAILYDLLLVLALLILGTLPFVAMRGGAPVDPGNLPYQLTLLGIAYLFFVGFWAGYGRTLGMQSWRLMIEGPDGGKPGIGAASLRFVTAIVSWLPFGLGFWWSLWDRDGLAWHDRLSRTRLVYYPKSKGSEPGSDPG
ncbi:MAG: RDD family protein [Woeseiaceae bacterium]|nr:RDD family protein [Woeseiaceae bacterium]